VLVVPKRVLRPHAGGHKRGQFRAAVGGKLLQMRQCVLKVARGGIYRRFPRAGNAMSETTLSG
jgi:hypothetical protein